MLDLDPQLVFKLKQFAKEVVLPPNGFLTVAFLGLLIARYRRYGRGFGTGIAIVAMLGWYLSAIPPGSAWLMQQVEAHAGEAFDEARAKEMMARAEAPGAIVVLGGGVMLDRREKPHQEILMPLALQRVHAAAQLARWTRLPVATSGGRISAAESSEAQVMARVLKEDLLTAVRWIEDESFDTADNAAMTAKKLQAENVRHILLVTQAFHMPRSQAAFEANGLKVTPAPVGFMSGQGADVESYWIPTWQSRERAAHAWRELIGQGWYWLIRNYLGDWLNQIRQGPVVTRQGN